MEKFGLLGNLMVYRVLGFVFLAMSLTYFFRPKAMIKLDNLGRKFIWSDDWTFRHRIITGIFFLVISLALIRAGALLGGGITRLGLFGNVFFYYILGGVLLLASISYLFAPKAMKKLDSLGREPVNNTPRVYGLHPRITGVFFLIVSLFMLWVGFFKELPSEKRFTHKEGLMAYYATSGDIIDEKIYVRYAKDYHHEIYKKYREDEFEWHNRLSEIKNELNGHVKRYDIKSINYWDTLTTELGRYDFKAKGFSYKSLSPTTYFSYYSRGYSSDMKSVRLFFENSGDFNFLPYLEDTAKIFVQSRKDKYGDINREVFTIVHFTLLPVKSKESQAVLNAVGANPYYYNLVARINKIEVYEDKERIMEMGLLTKTPSK